MSVMESVKKRRIDAQGFSNVTREIAIHIAYFVSGILVSKGALLGELSPFSASFAAAVPFSYMPSGLIGTALGYMFFNPYDSFRYIAIIIAIGALRWVLNEFKRVSDSRYFSPIIAFLPVFATSLALTFSSSSEITDITMCIVEAVIAAAAAYFMSSTVSLCSSRKSLKSLTGQETACLVMTGCILLLSLDSLSIGKVSVGRVLAVLVVLICARYGSVTGGTVSGVATGIVFSLSANDYIFLSSGYAFGGLMGGLFAPVGKVAVAVAFTLCNTIMAFSAQNADITLAIFIETLFAFGIFMALPKSVGRFVSGVFSTDGDKTDTEAIRRSVTMRLSFASKALQNVSSCVNSVSDRLARLYTPTAQWIYDNAAQNTCSKCGLRVYCWDRQKDSTVSDFNCLTSTLKKSGFVKENDIEENFTKKCCRASELANSISQSYKDYLSCEAARRRITQIRSVVAGQFAGLSDILEDLSQEFEDYDSYDTDCSQRIIEALSSIGLVAVDCSCRNDITKGMIVELTLALNKRATASKSQILREVSKCCSRRFDTPCLSYASDRIRVVLNELPNFDVEIGSAQHIFSNGELCGDCLNYFNNGLGSTVCMISDGMGTGGRAAVDSNMATSILSKLCKAGLSYDCSLQVVNSSLMVKSEDESMATLDVLDFNLFSGKAEFMKAGACASYIKKNSKLIKKDMPSLPVGILSEVRFSKEAVTLSDDDWIVMVSDGALCADDEWLTRLIMSWRDGSATDLSAKIVDEAIKRRNDDHDDDITAIAIRVIEN